MNFGVCLFFNKKLEDAALNTFYEIKQNKRLSASET